MSADYQALMLLSILLSFGLYDIVFKPNASSSSIYGTLGFSCVVFVVAGYRIFEMSTDQIAFLVLLFSAFAGVYGALNEIVIGKYIKGKLMRFAYLAHIGIWPVVIVWLTRWTF
ncbi:hypothetical protein pEaSNUABM23_00198 [Erwinia phage pEa_SNUABM_23]|uniref:Uncharacterized protein n=1 Tax=Erwinia phage pEa_SNUABM_3 TaxID=2869552 RepID=A0AAE8C081_9CAUD|nr:hypothetical protein MPK68_gp199 [Erwinia phage pEa_SNUABM_3]QZE56396.1 hypothetical protein pEaSNUABM3_00199 [Erwinia phage pEa_SNUABM_3]QZE56735.1 hypothetical protein pEaSNUABM20_00199 [Erwinia phage pEa_SNUABM_20]UAW52980.1 hypothetical protein pEaSNUABM23_00198 [Erwinia phage pEa_SNUABM_23]UIW10876.1 hypothetical protein pEaSNUABM23_00198 [Erwinia phage pEa_SNUABM_31]